ncbi:MAG: hypothetical protein J5I93_18100, partial [Pirellulaceae bacterium]|nr:hypothetical protein [Pirellulaceae bacterium]
MTIHKSSLPLICVALAALLAVGCPPPAAPPKPAPAPDAGTTVAPAEPDAVQPAPEQPAATP